jgi:hypothetical protein
MAKKVVLIVLGAIGIMIGLGLLAGGAIVLALTGGDGFLDTGPHPLATSTYALVAEPTAIRTGSSFDESGPDVRLRVQVTSTEPVFVGVGPATDVDSYLAGVPVDEVVSIDFTPFTMRTDRREGSRKPAAPDDQTFWTARAAGTGQQTLEWDARVGIYRVVLMKLDGSLGVQATARFGIRIPFLHGVGLGLLGGGGVSVLVGVLLLIFGIRAKVNRAPAGYPGQFGPPGVYPPPGPYPAGYPAQGYPGQGYPGQGYPPQGYPGQGYPGQDQYGQYPAGQYAPEGQTAASGQYPAEGQYPPGGQYGQYPPAAPYDQSQPAAPYPTGQNPATAYPPAEQNPAAPYPAGQNPAAPYPPAPDPASQSPAENPAAQYPAPPDPAGSHPPAATPTPGQRTGQSDDQPDPAGPAQFADPTRPADERRDQP